MHGLREALKQGRGHAEQPLWLWLCSRMMAKLACRSTAKGIYKGRKPSIDPAQVRRLLEVEGLGPSMPYAWWFGYGRASKTMLNGVSVARRMLVNPPADITSRSLASPACAPRAVPTSCASDVGTQIMVEPA